MLAFVVLGALIVCSLAFVMWLAMFVLSRGINTNLETDAESRRIASRQLFAGAVILAAAIALGVVYSRMNAPAVIPEIGPGLGMDAPKVKAAIESQAAGEAAVTEAPRTGEAESVGEGEE